MLKALKVLSLVLTIILISVAFTNQDDSPLTRILTKLHSYLQYRPQQKLYLHFDKPLYAAGEDIWFSSYLLNATQHTPDSLNKIIYAELYDGAKNLLQRRVLYSPNGMSHGDFHLGDTLPAGNYVIRAYTNYMKNLDEDFQFIKEIQVLSNRPQHITIHNDKIDDVQFFPEGGNLLAGVENRIAFKVINSTGEGADTEGTITDDENNIITNFKTEHEGMGVLKITPVLGKHYQARIKNSNTIYKLSDVMQKGFLLRIMDAGPLIKVIAYSNLKQYSDAPCIVNIVAQSRGVVTFAARGEILNTSLITNIPKSKIPSGITQITLFDGAGVPQCERLVFVNHQNNLSVSVLSDKSVYNKREKINLTIHVNANGGKSAQGHFSLSVYDEGKIKDTRKYPSDIVNNLLLTSDLKGRINEPGYYLKDTLPTTKYHLDLLMMTHGWRRFTWKTILSDTIAPLQYYAEQGITISGKLSKTITNKPAKNSELKILTSSRDILVIKTDSLGRFYNDNLLYYDSTELFIQTDNAKGKQSDMKLQLNPFNTPPPLLYQPAITALPDAQYFLDQQLRINNIIRDSVALKNASMLKEVEVKASRIEENTTPKIYGTADATIKMKDIPQGYTNILQALQGRVAGVMVSGTSVSIRGGGEPLFLLNGMQVDLTTVSNIPINDVESIDVLKGVSASIYGGRGGNGVIAIYLKKGGASRLPSIGVHNLKYPGLYKVKEFYSPKYDSPNTASTSPDIRNTLYWNPAIKTNSSGEVQLSFYTSDVTSTYKILIEGISNEGVPGVSSKVIEVK